MLVDKPEFKLYFVRLTIVIIYGLKEGCIINKAIDLTNDFIEGLSFCFPHARWQCQIYELLS